MERRQIRYILSGELYWTIVPGTGATELKLGGIGLVFRQTTLVY